MSHRNATDRIPFWIAGVMLALLSARAPAQQQSVVNTKHNLSASGPGTVKAIGEQEVCIFCHTPHHATTITPLWNRNVSVTAYRVYSSTTLQAKPGQPTGASKLCLSCHDGTIALGSVASRDVQIGMAGGITTLPPGKTNIGTDLSDDHPISFIYDSALAEKNVKLKDPRSLPATVRLDKQMNLQCNSCHNVHDNTYGRFLVMDNSNSQLCATCHKAGQTQTITGHQQCASCHQIHTAPSGPHLLVGKTVTDACQTCHGGQVAQAPNIAPDLVKVSVHDTKPAADTPTVPNDVACSNCHEPHSMTKVTAVAPNIRGNFGSVSGISAAGAIIPAARYEYEVCFKCHAEQQPSGLTTVVTRQVVQTNTRLEFATSAISYHPVEAAGKNTDMPSLTGMPYTSASIIYCSDCHNTDRSRFSGGAGPDGTHGSNNRPLLALNYTTVDGTPESANAYALCYKCHNRNTFITEGGAFKYHKKHVQEKNAPCSICHDSHGISSTQGTTRNLRLINFDTKIVRPSSGGRLEYNSIGNRSGRCYLTCHGKNHNPLTYAP